MSSQRFRRLFWKTGFLTSERWPNRPCSRRLVRLAREMLNESERSSPSSPFRSVHPRIFPANDSVPIPFYLAAPWFQSAPDQRERLSGDAECLLSHFRQDEQTPLYLATTFRTNRPETRDWEARVPKYEAGSQMPRQR